MDNWSWYSLTAALLTGVLVASSTILDAETALRDPHIADFSFVMAPRETLNLEGTWQLTGGEADFVPPQGDDLQWLDVNVPCGIRNAQFAGKLGWPVALWLRREVEVPASWQGKVIRLHFEMTRARTEIYLNGTHVGSHWDGYYSYELDVTHAARPGERNELLVAVGDMPSIATKEKGSWKSDYPLGWTWAYTRFVGIRLPCWLEATDPIYITQIFCKPAVNPDELELALTMRNAGGDPREVTVDAQIVELDPAQEPAKQFKSRTVTLQPGENVINLREPFPNAYYWWPDDPHLYYAEVSLKADGQVLDGYRQRFGFREVEVDGPDILLNGQKLLLSRTAVIAKYIDPEQVVRVAEQAKARDYRGVRLHGAAAAVWFDWADELGILLIPESAVCSTGQHNLESPEFWEHFKEHALGMVRDGLNNPSVVMWNASNEIALYGGNKRIPDCEERMTEVVNAMLELDPTRTVSCDGDVDLGGRIETVNLHYPFHPRELRRMLPRNIYWLEGGPIGGWQGYKWQQDKPMIMGEYGHLPYEFSPPHGLSELIGDRAYVHPAGWHEGILRLYRMLNDGFRHARVACLNPWGVPEGVYDFGSLFPPVLIAVRENDHSFRPGQIIRRTVYLYNDTLHKRDFRFVWRLVSGGELLEQHQEPMAIPPGEQRELHVELTMPQSQTRQELVWSLAMFHQGTRVAAEERILVVHPASEIALAGDYVAVVAPGAEAEVGALLGTDNVFADLPEAFAARPQAMLIVGVKLADDQVQRLTRWLREGRKVACLNLAPGSELPGGLKVDGGHFAAHAWRRCEHPVLESLTDYDLSLWGQDTLVTDDTIVKLSRGQYRIILDAGGPSGLKWTPLVEIPAGQGSFLLCQMLAVAKAQECPAAAQLLANIIRWLVTPPQPTDYSIKLTADADSPLSKAVAGLGLPMAQNGDASAWVIDAAATLPDASQLQAFLRNGGTVVLHGLTPETVGAVEAALGCQITVQESERRIRAEKLPAPSPLGAKVLAGLSNYDFFWAKNEFGQKGFDESGPGTLLAKYVITGLDGGEILTDPGLLAVLPVDQGRVIFDQILWPESLEEQSEKAARIGTTLLANAAQR